MKLNEGIYQRLTSFTELTEKLTTYAKKPAIFEMKAPDDSEKSWNKKHYPMLVYNFDLQANEERGSAGTLLIDVFCDLSQELDCDSVIRAAEQSFKDIFIKANDTLYGFSWNRSDGFEVEKAQSKIIVGASIRFDILEFVNQTTTDPCPIQALTKTLFDRYGAKGIVGIENTTDILNATEKPIIVPIIKNLQKGTETYTVCFMDSDIAIHIFYADIAKRKQIVSEIAYFLSSQSELIMLDKSPMHLTKIDVRMEADSLRSGQIRATYHYGILKSLPMEKKITKIRTKFI